MEGRQGLSNVGVMAAPIASEIRNSECEEAVKCLRNPTGSEGTMVCRF